MDIGTVLNNLECAGDTDKISILTNNGTILINGDTVDLMEREDDNTIFISLKDEKVFIIDVNSIIAICIYEK